MSTQIAGGKKESMATGANGRMSDDFPGPARPTTPAHVIQDDREAIVVAHRLAERFVKEDAIRDQERRLPFSELDEFSQSGLWGMTVPKEFGGAEVSYVTAGEVIKISSAADALLERAGRFVDVAVASPNEHSVAEASVAVAEAKAMATEVSLLATNKLFELAGTRSTLEEYNLDRHWRNARTHTLHDPVRWKYHAIGNYWLNGILPPRHGAS